MVRFLILSGSFSALGAQSFALVTNAYSGKISWIDLYSDSEVAELRVADSVGPPVPSIAHMALDTIHGWVFVADHMEGAISIVDLAGWRTTGPVTVSGMGKLPIGLALNGSCDRLFVTTRGPNGAEGPNNPLEVIAISGDTFPPTLTWLDSVAVGRHPINVVLSHDERYAVVTCRNQACITVVELADFSVERVFNFPDPDFEPEGLDIHPTENILYAFTHGRNTIEVIDLDSMAIVAHVDIVNDTPFIPVQPSGGWFTPDGQRVFISGQTAGKVFVFDATNPRHPVQTDFVIPVGPQPHHILFLPYEKAYVANTNNGQPAGSISIISTDSSPSALGWVAGSFEGPLHFVLVEQDSDAREGISLAGNTLLKVSPNPFGGRTTITYALSAPSDVQMRAYDESGRMVGTLVDGEQASGPHTFCWEPKGLEPGLYFIVLSGRDFREVSALVILE